MRHTLVIVSACFALSACTQSTPEPSAVAASQPPPAELQQLGGKDKPRLSVPTESVGAHYKPRTFTVNAPAEDGKPKKADQPAN